MGKTEQELTGIARAYFEYSAWFVAERFSEHRKWTARSRQEALVAERVATLVVRVQLK